VTTELENSLYMLFYRQKRREMNLWNEYIVIVNEQGVLLETLELVYSSKKRNESEALAIILNMKRKAKENLQLILLLPLWKKSGL
jgi:hypothetical protein